MKFQRGKATLDPNKPLEEETLQRWRAAAMKGGKAGNDPKFVEREIDLQEATGPLSKSTSLPNETRPSNSGNQISNPRAISQNSDLSIEQDLQRRFGKEIKAALGTGTTIEGKLSFESPVRIDGTLKGEITSTSTLIIGEGGVVEASVKVGSLVVLGQVVGNVHAQELVEIRSTGSLEGDISTKRIMIEEGAYFAGRSSMPK